MLFFLYYKRKLSQQDWLTADEFLAGYGAAQAVPGPLFTFASYLGMASFGWRGALGGINAAVVGILLAALYHPVWTKAVKSPLDFSLALLAFALLTIWKWPPWLVVLFSLAAGTVFSFVP